MAVIHNDFLLLMTPMNLAEDIPFFHNFPISIISFILK